MRFAKLIIALVALLLGPAWLARAADLAMNDAPYSPIVARNIFGLLPIPTVNPADATAASATPPPKITPNGMMTLMGIPQALFKVSYPPAAGQPAHEQSYVLAQGESQDNIEVVKIDMASAVVTFNNNGTVQELPLAAAPKITAPAAPVGNPGGGIGGGPSGGQGGGIPRPIIGGPRGPRAAANPNPAGEAPTDANGVPSIAANPGNIVNGIYNPGAQNDGLSPEARALLIEKAYLDAQQNQGSGPGHVSPSMFPTTPLRDQSNASLNGGAGGGQ